MADVPLPFQPEFQQRVAAMLLKDPAFQRSFLGKVSGTNFTDPVAGSVVGVLKRFAEKYSTTTDHVALYEFYTSIESDTDKQEVFKERLDAIRETDCIAKEFTKERLSTFLVLSALRATLEDVVDDVMGGTADASIITSFRTALKAGDADDDGGKGWKESIGKVLADELDPEKRRSIPTGLPHLDQCLGGGLRPGELGVLLAPPKGFKSGALLNFAWGAAQRGFGYSSDYFTLELSEALQNLRYAFRVSGLGKADYMANPEKFRRIMQKRHKLLLSPHADLYVKFMAPYACTPSKLRSHLEEKRDRGEKLGVVFVDYLDLMGSDTKREKSYQEAVQIATDLRQVAIDMEVPIWTAARATREAVGKKRINMSHMATSFERVAIADYVYALCCTDEERANNRMRIVPVASRNDGADRIIECAWHPRVMSLRSVEAREMTDDDFEESSGTRMDKGKAKDSLEKLVQEGREKAKRES